MNYSITISISPEHLDLVMSQLSTGESRSKFFVKAAVKEALQRKGE